MNSIAIITARGGSKRIPRKNIKNFCGKPILAYSIEAALESKVFDEVMVSTDDDEISEIAKKYGAKVPFIRTEATSNDFATTSDVLLEVFEEYKKRGQFFEQACCIYPTAPFVTADKLINAMDLLIKTGAETVISVSAYSYPPQRSMYISDGKLRMFHPEHLCTRSQDLEPIYHDCGQFYSFFVDCFLKNQNLIGKVVVPIIVDELEVQDIDTETDWIIAEMKYRLMQERKDNIL